MHICPVLLSPCPFWRLGRNVHLSIEDMNPLPVPRDLEQCSKVFSWAYISRKSSKKDHVIITICISSDTTVTAVTAAVSMAMGETRLEQQYECVSSVWALRELSETWSPLSKGNIMDVCHERAMAWVQVILRQSRILASEEDRQH